ncbi:uncharacterized protein DNG_02593 [Cephalotrichum gorgonifer]|uniref:Uncharacterized protein n=1 Tax=Cephalotrichum gorgonifer TaxID=2041049 RepID=A0AAE8SSS4_9PEZI|nr:uncharacterized protein DNG_02593 [Cephalotrichum gorgonifer]
MVVYGRNLLAAMALLLAGATAIDLTSEMNSGWTLGLRPRQAAQNLQSFAGSLGGVAASAISNSGDPERPFTVDGDTFNDFATAAGRSCDNQKNNCAELANNGGGDFEVGDCDKQNEACKAGISSASATSFGEPALVSSDAQFDFFCDV